jgi:hypothetical protein
MVTVLESVPELTRADLFERFGPMPAARISMVPQSGTATVQDLLPIHRREKKLCELVNGVFLEKAPCTE